MNLFRFNSLLAWHGPMGCSSTRLQSIREGTVQYSSTTENLLQTLCNTSNATQIAPELQLLWIMMRILCLCTSFLKEWYSQHKKNNVIIYALSWRSKLLCCYFVWGDIWRMFTLLFPIQRQFIVTTSTPKIIVKEVCRKSSEVFQ